MKRLTKIFQALLGAAALILASLVAAGRLTWRIIRKWWKKSSRRIRIIFWAILALIAMYIGGCYIKYLYDSKYGRDLWDRYVTNNVELHSFADGTYRVYNYTTDQYTTGKINWLSDTGDNDTWAVYAKPGKRGYIDTNSGSIVIDADSNCYSKAWVFSEGMAAVMKDGKIGFINKKNEIVIPFIHEWSDECRSWDFGYAFHDSTCVMTVANGQVGVINTKGEWITEAKYDDIWRLDDNGYRISRKDSYFGILASTGCEVYPAVYDYIDILPDGFILTKDGTMQQVDFCGNIVKPFMFDGTYWLNYPVGYNENGEIKYEFADYAKYKVMYRFGIMNRITGEPVTPAIYEDINMLAEGLFEVQDPISYDWHLVDKNGKEVIKE